MKASKLVVIVLVIVLVIPTATAGVASAGARGEPGLTAYLPDNSVTPGEETTLNLFVLNGGDIDYADSEASVSRVTTARDARLTLKSGNAPITVETETTPIGSIPDGVSNAISFEISVDESAKPGTYELPLEVEYRYTRQISGAGSPVYSDRDETETLQITIEIERDARFKVVSTTADSFTDGTGTVELEVKNVGQESARDARLSLTSKTSELTFDASSTTETFVGAWAPGEVKEFAFEGDLAQQAGRHPYLLTAQVDYEDSDGEPRTSETLYTGATPGTRASQFAIRNVDSNLKIGETGMLSLTVRNTENESIRDARLALVSDDPKLTFAGTKSTSTFIGALPPDGTTSINVEARITPGADIRFYPVSATMTFVDETGDTRTSDPIVTAVAPQAQSSQFAINNTTTNIAPGESGPVTLRIENTEEPVRDARLTVSSTDPKLTFTGNQKASTFVGTWDAGEVRTFTYTTNIDDRADVRQYPLSVSVTYTTADGETRESEPAITGVIPQIKQFRIENIKSTLVVGEEGTLQGDLTNSGETSATNAVIVFESTNSNIKPVETEYRVGTIAPNERVPFNFDIETSENAAGGPRQFSVRVRYRDANNDVRRSDVIDINADVAGKRDTFTVKPIAATFTPGQEGTLQLQVTNTGNETLTDISAKLFTNDPLSSDDDEAYIDRLSPNESATLSVGLTVGSGAMAKAYPAELDFQYDDADGDTLLSDTYRISVTVSEQPDRDPSPIVLIGVVVGLLVVGGGLWWYRESIQGLFS